MRKLAILVLAASAAIAMPRRAEASSCSHTQCLPGLEPIAYAMGAGIVGLYGYGIGYYAYHDVTGGEQSMFYDGSELMLHGALGGVFAGMAVEGMRKRKPGVAIGASVFAAVHLTLATNGARGLYRRRDELRMPSDTLLTWTAGTVYGINTLYWASAWPGPHARGRGIAEVAVNAPIALGLGYLAHQRFSDRDAPAGMLYTGMTAVSTLYVAHGLRVAIAPTKGRKKLDLLGTELMPTVVSDGVNMGPGLGTGGSF
jgi:hypothetical protein